MENTKQLFITCLCILLTSIIFAQKYSVQIPKNKIAKNHAFEIKAICEGGKIKSCSAFPEIKGFKKGHTSQNTSVQIMNGNMSQTHIFSQVYIPTQEGNFVLKPFDIEINGQKVHSNGTKIKVTPPAQSQRNNPFSMFDDPFFQDPFFSRRKQQQPVTYKDVKDKAFFSVSTSKKEAYVGEAIHIEASFYTAEDNQATFAWHEIEKSMKKIQDDLLPKNCWYEQNQIVNLDPTSVNINGKAHKKYVLFEAVIFPYNLNDIILPSMPLKMIKYKESNQRDIFGRVKKQQDFKTFYSQKKTIKIKDLPPHPLKDQVAVGNFYLYEKIHNKRDKPLQTNGSVKYEFRIRGEGNFNALEAPNIPQNSDLTFFEPTSTQKIQLQNNQLKGEKKFEYFIIPQEPGEYDLSKYMQWVFFNPRTEVYDTLASQKIIQVEGESMKNSTIENTDLGNFYDRITLEDNKLENLETQDTFKWFANISIFLMLVIVVTLGVKKNKKNE